MQAQRRQHIENEREQTALSSTGSRVQIVCHKAPVAILKRAGPFTAAGHAPAAVRSPRCSRSGS